jgi:hypothetical protein
LLTCSNSEVNVRRGALSVAGSANPADDLTRFARATSTSTRGSLTGRAPNDASAHPRDHECDRTAEDPDGDGEPWPGTQPGRAHADEYPTRGGKDACKKW